MPQTENGGAVFLVCGLLRLLISAAVLLRLWSTQNAARKLARAAVECTIWGSGASAAGL